MRPTFMGFETAKSAIFTNQKAIDIVGNNLSNIDTTGYTRQRVETSSVAPSSFTTRVNSSRIGLLGQGVEALGVSQMRDSLLDKRFRDEYSKASYHAQSADILNDIQSALGDGKDISDLSGLFGAMADIFNAINDYASEPTLETQANIVMSSFRNITQVLQQMDAKLTNVAAQQTYDTSINVDRVNDIFAQIANLNKMISGDDTVLSDPGNEHYRPNELLDQRNLLLDELASYGDINVTSFSDGTVNVDFGGERAITGREYNTLIMNQHDDATISIKWSSNGKDIQTSQGILRASLDYINGRGANVQSKYESPQQGIPYYRDKIDTFANALADMANHAIPLVNEDGEYVDESGNVLTDGKIVYKTLIAAKGENGETNSKLSVTAGNISISDEWTKGGAGYFICSREEDMRQYAQSIAYNLTKAPLKFKAYGETYTGTFEEYYTDVLSKLGSDVSFQEGRQAAVALVADDFQNRRDEISGVSRDEETANMLMYQKSYEAAARLMTTLDDLLDVLINRTGRAGL